MCHILGQGSGGLASSETIPTKVSSSAKLWEDTGRSPGVLWFSLEAILSDSTVLTLHPGFRRPRNIHLSSPAL